MKAQWENSREVTERIYITGQLLLETPAHFGNGDNEAVTDIPLMLDALDGKTPLLTGTSITGALRNYLRELELGYGVAERETGASMAEKLFGHLWKKSGEKIDSVLSWLMVDDALGKLPAAKTPIEIRDGVAIDPRTRTVLLDKNDKGQKYDVELLAAGTTFHLHFELWLKARSSGLLEALALALEGFENGKIGLGLRKNRGFGQCRVTGWQVKRYTMKNPDGILGWLEHQDAEGGEFQPNIKTLLGVTKQQEHRGEKFVLDARFKLKSSLHIRSHTGEPTGPDSVHLHSLRNNAAKPILSGTSLAGVIRGRALRIVKTMKEKVADDFIYKMFGKPAASDDTSTGSWVIVYETEIENGIQDLVQNRIKIDRFTGGAFPNALFSEQPLFAKTAAETRLHIKLELRKTPTAKNFDAEIGLLLLVLKDLWTGDLALGGESSIGRGRLQGLEATLALGKTIWKITQGANNNLLFSGNGKQDDLEKRFLQAFLEV
jgi:CRISPR/Cas system CSM-associated protein Csm3 (group 7 of RAMP superfamily)